MSPAPLPPGLARFFEVAGPFLVRGEGDPAAVEAALGPSPSGTARLARTRELVDAQQVEALGTLHPRLRRALDHGAPGSFAALARAYARAYRSRVPHPAGVSAALPAFLTDRGTPPWAAELADYEALRFALATAPDPPPEAWPNPVRALRRYGHAVHRATAERPTPAARPTTLLVVRDARSLRVRAAAVGVAELAALGLATGEVAEHELPAWGLGRERLETARARLAALTVLDPAAPRPHA